MEMGVNYTEFKEYAAKRQFGELGSTYNEIIKLIEEFYSKEEIIFFYPRNIWNDEKKEFILFFNDGYATINIVDDKYVIEQFNSKLKSKTLKTSSYYNTQQLLSLEFENGNWLGFNSLKDSNGYWDEMYAKTIRDIYKAL